MIGLEACLLAVPAGLLGAAVGSFSATAAIRLSQGETPWFGRSRCDGCARQLGWSETVPIASYYIARGRCLSCGSTIHPLHLGADLAGLVIGTGVVALMPDLKGITLAGLGLCLLALALIDITTKTLPNGLNLLVALTCGLLAVLNHRIIEGGVAAALTAALLMAVKWTLERNRGRIMLGLGDVKLLTALAVGLGEWTPIATAAAAGIGLGIMFLRRRTSGELPFGPMIAASGYVFAVLSTTLGGLS